MCDFENNNIYCYPNSMEENDYLNINFRLWREMGLNVFPFKSLLKKLITPRLWFKDYVVLNFFENTVLGRFAGLRLLRAVVFLLLARLLVRKIIWVRHNYIPHSLNGVNIHYFNCISFLLNKLSHEIVVHRPVKDFLMSHVVPHPLYLNFNSDQHDNNLDEDKDKEFLYFGQVRENKGLCQLLECWPTDTKLTMLGACNDSVLENRIRGIISFRNLNVIWDNIFVSKGLLDEAIYKADCIVIPHVDKSMIVTGAAFHAMSLGANLVINESDFSNWMITVYPFSSSYNYSNLTEIIHNVNLLKKSDVMVHAKNVNSDDKVKRAWKSVFLSTS
ncbi:MAG: beta-1,4-mannosyltransferase [Psychroserpens sp.]